MNRTIAAKLGIAAAALSLVLAWTYHAGRAQGVSHERTRMVDSVRRVMVDSSRAIEARMANRVVAIQKADTAAIVARARHGAVAKRIVPVTDSTVSIDGGAPVTDVPATLVIPALYTCQQAITADTIDTNLIRAQLVEMTHDRDVQKARAELDEANAVKAPRFGFRSGFAVGGAIVAIAAHFLR